MGQPVDISNTWHSPNRPISREYETGPWDSTGAKGASPHVVTRKVLNPFGSASLGFPREIDAFSLASQRCGMTVIGNHESGIEG